MAKFPDMTRRKGTGNHDPMSSQIVAVDVGTVLARDCFAYVCRPSAV